MSLSTNCPGCQTGLVLGEHLRGKKIRCKKCSHVFVVEAAPARASKQERIQRQPRAVESPAASEDDDLEDRPRRMRRRDDSAALPSLRRTNRGLILCLVLCGFGLLFVGGASVLAIVFWRAYGKDVSGQFDKDFRGSWPVPSAPAGLFGADTPEDTIVTLHIAGVEDVGSFEAIYDKASMLADGGGGRIVSTKDGNRMTVLLAPVRDPQACADKIDFGTVRAVNGRTINVVAHKIEGLPKDADAVTKALHDLKSPNFTRRLEAGQRLKKMAPDEKRRAEVARVLQEAMVNDNNAFSRAEIVEALAIWGTKDSVPVLINALADDNPFTRRSIFKALARLKDERACEPLALHLEDFADRQEAAAALKSMGSIAEKAVRKRLQHPDHWVRQEACKILGAIGTKESLPELQKATTDGEGFVSQEAQAALQAIKRRQ